MVTPSPLQGAGGFQRLLPRGIPQNSHTLPRRRLRELQSEDGTGHVPARSGAGLGPASPRGLSRSRGSWHPPPRGPGLI